MTVEVEAAVALQRLEEGGVGELPLPGNKSN